MVCLLVALVVSNCNHLHLTQPAPAMPRTTVFQALRNKCLLPVQSEDSQNAGAAAIINLDEVIASLTSTALVEHELWASSLPAVKALMEEYKSTASMLSGIMRFVFLKQPAFCHVSSDKDKVPPETLHEWRESVAKKMMNWISDPGMLQDVSDLLIEPIKTELEMLYSAGLDSVAPVVEQLLGGLLGAGLSKGVFEDLMQKVPLEHPLRALVKTFGEAGPSFMQAW